MIECSRLSCSAVWIKGNPPWAEGYPNNHNNWWAMSLWKSKLSRIPSYIPRCIALERMRQGNKYLSWVMCTPFASLIHRSSFTSEWPFVIVSPPRFHGMAADGTTFQWYLLLVGCTLHKEEVNTLVRTSKKRSTSTSREKNKSICISTCFSSHNGRPSTTAHSHIPNVRHEMTEQALIGTL